MMDVDGRHLAASLLEAAGVHQRGLIGFVAREGGGDDWIDERSRRNECHRRVYWLGRNLFRLSASNGLFRAAKSRNKP
jgi:hypothetical protein